MSLLARHLTVTTLRLLGEDNGFALPYAALVAPDETTMALSGAALPVGGGMINSVAINQAGAAIIGGNDNGSTLLSSADDFEGSYTIMNVFFKKKTIFGSLRKELPEQEGQITKAFFCHDWSSESSLK